MPGQIRGQAIVFKVIGNEHGHSGRGQQIRPCQKISKVNLAADHKVAHGDFHELNDFAGINARLGCEFFVRTSQHVHIGEGHGTKATPLYQNRFFIEHFRRLKHGTIGGKHRRFTQAQLHKLHAHHAVIDMLKGVTGEFDHINLNAIHAQSVQQ